MQIFTEEVLKSIKETLCSAIISEYQVFQRKTIFLWYFRIICIKL